MTHGVVAARERLAAGRAHTLRLHRDGADGRSVARELTELLDTVVGGLIQRALDGPTQRPPDFLSHVALVAHAGYGRGDVSPFSDVDLMLLHTPAVSEAVKPLARRLVMDVADAGLQLGFSVRTLSQACSLAVHDAAIFTSLTESRLLAGDAQLFEHFRYRFWRETRCRRPGLIAAVRSERRKERVKFGETVYLLEPNVKRSRGTLRDIQLLRWIAFIQNGQTGLDRLCETDTVSRADYDKLLAAQQFLLRVRHEMHFHSGRAHDLLDRAEQVRLAEFFGFAGQPEQLPVEQFMQQYFRHTSEVRNVVAAFVAGAAPRPAWTRVADSLLSHQVEGDFRVGPRFIGATRRGLGKLAGSPDQVLRLMDLANLYDKRIEPATWEAIREDMMARARPTEITPEAARRFLSLLEQPARLGRLLRQLHELRVLEMLVPGVRHARSLLQFNDYHKYTVDEHCIRAVEAATDLARDSGPMGRAYRRIPNKRVLHLALLMHDLGKGYAGDHSEKGVELAATAAERLGLPAEEAETLEFLIGRHLAMSHLAFRRDTTDRSLIVRFAVEVGSPELLRMLYVCTCADLTAVGPGMLNSWRRDVLTTLFYDVRDHLTAGSALDAAGRQSTRREEVRAELRTRMADRADSDRFDRQVDALPPAYLRDAPAGQVAEDLLRASALGGDDAAAWGVYLAHRKAVRFTIATHENAAGGIFHKLTGALSSQGLAILSAEIHTLADGLVLDRFEVRDADFTGCPPQERFDAVCRRLVGVLRDASDSPPAFRRVWQTGGQRLAASLAAMPTRVEIDNTTSDRHTIVDVFTHDRTGLLYAIARTLFELDLSVEVAKIGTYLDQVVDVFYVADRNGGIVDDPDRLQQIRERLLRTIESLDDEQAADGGRGPSR